jgi:hypothetical protein
VAVGVGADEGVGVAVGEGAGVGVGVGVRVGAGVIVVGDGVGFGDGVDVFSDELVGESDLRVVGNPLMKYATPTTIRSTKTKTVIFFSCTCFPPSNVRKRSF